MGALLSLCDGLIWSELGTAYPEAGGSYAYLKHLYGERTLGRAFSFLYAWQLLISAPLSIASGCIGFSQYLSFFFRTIRSSLRRCFPLRSSNRPQRPDSNRDGRLLRRSRRSLPKHLRHRPHRSMARSGRRTHPGPHHRRWLHPLRRSTRVRFPARRLPLNHAFFVGLGAGMLISAYDYWGYYNVCFLGAEVRDPQRTIPRAVLGAIGVVATLYLLMNISVLGVLPWREMAQNTDSHARMFTMAVFMETALRPHRGRRYRSAYCRSQRLRRSWRCFSDIRGSPSPRLATAIFLHGSESCIRSYRIPMHSLVDSGRHHSALLHLSAARGHHDPGGRSHPVSVLAAGNSRAACPKHRQERKMQGIPYAALPLPVLLALSGFVFILIFAAEFLARDERPPGVILIAGATVYGFRDARMRNKSTVMQLITLNFPGSPRADRRKYSPLRPNRR